MKTFSFRKQFKSILWKDTLLLNLFRSVSAGIVWMIIAVIFRISGDDSLQMPMYGLLLFPIIIPVIYFIFYLPIGLACGFLSDLGVPWVGLMTMFVALFVVIGDPLVCILLKKKPNLVLIEKFGFFNFKMVVFVTEE